MTRWCIGTNEIVAYDTPGPIGSFALRRGGGMVGASDKGFLSFDLSTGTFTPRVDPKADDHPEKRFNNRPGRFWCSLVAGGKVLRLDLMARVMLEIDMPVPRTTSRTFGGPGYDRMFVTPQRLFMTDAELEAYPRSGIVLVIDGLWVKGVPKERFAGLSAGLAATRVAGTPPWRPAHGVRRTFAELLSKRG